jgi:hypothetical protein
VSLSLSSSVVEGANLVISDIGSSKPGGNETELYTSASGL